MYEALAIAASIVGIALDVMVYRSSLVGAALEPSIGCLMEYGW
jgi:hypothetical protein